jgi:hypothetical protein
VTAAGQPTPEFTFEDVRLRVYRNNELKLQGRAARVELMRSTGALVAHDAHFTLPAEALTLQTPQLTGNLSTLAFDGSGGLLLESTEQPLIARTPTAHFEAREGSHGIVAGQEPIDVVGARDGRPFKIDAEQFRFDIGEQHASFESVNSRVGAD